MNGIMIDILLANGSTSPYDDGCPELLRGLKQTYNDSDEEHGPSEVSPPEKTEELLDATQISRALWVMASSQNASHD